MVRRRRGYGNQGPDPETGFFGGIDMVLKIEGVKGECEIPGYEGWIDVLAWSFGMSRSIDTPQVPMRARKLKQEEKKKLLAAAGFDEDEQPMEDSEVAKLSRQEQRDRLEEALRDFDEEANLEFDESEVGPRRTSKASVQDISMTKYCGLDSAQIYAMTLAQKKGIEVQLKCLKSRAKKKEESADGASSSAAAAEKKTEKKTNEDGGEAEEEEVPREYIVAQEFTFCDAYLSSVSTGGSGGEDRFTENLTITFGSWMFRIVDWRAKADPEKLKVGGAEYTQPEASIIFDPLRNVVKPFKSFVKSQLDQNDEIKPVSSVVLGYL